MKNTFEILITDVPDREYLVAEVWCNSELLAEISHENITFDIRFYPYAIKEECAFDFDELIDQFKTAKLKLLAALPNVN